MKARSGIARTTCAVATVAVIAALAGAVALRVAGTAATPARAEHTVATASTAPGTPHVASRTAGAPSRRRTTPTDTGCVIVRLKSGVTTRQAAAVAPGARKLGSTGLVTLPAPKGMTAAEFAGMLERSPLVAFAQPDYLLKPAADYTSTPNDPDFSDPYAYPFSGTLGNVVGQVPHARSWPLRGAGSANFDEVWPALASANATAGQVHVAVMDTGFYFSHPDVAGSNIRPAIDECATYDPVTSQLTTDAVCEPVSRTTRGTGAGIIEHGTMTASEIGAGADNGVGGTGAAYDTQVDIYKVMGVYSRSGAGATAGWAVMPVSALVNAIGDATDASVAGHYRLVINVSLELTDPAPGEVPALTTAVAYAKAHDVVVVAASGNAGTATISYPAALPGAIAVGGYTVATGAPAWATYSNYGPALFLLAPGGGSAETTGSPTAFVWGPADPTARNYSPGETAPRIGYDWWEGTSMAAPYAASAAALLLRVQPDLTRAEVASYLASGAVDMGAPGWDAKTGWGRLDAYRSFLLLAMPHTTSDVRPRYASGATIAFSASSRRSGTTFTTFYTLDDTHSVLTGAHADTSALGPHTLTYWSVAADGVAEQAHTATFSVLPPDTTPPSTSSHAVSAYTGSACISLVATDSGPDAWGVGQTQFALDGGPTQTGTTVVTGRYGSHTLRFWSTDLAGNTEPAHAIAFTVRQALPTLTLARSASTIRRNQSVRLSGYLTPARTGDRVRIQVRYPGSSHWVNYTSSYQRTISSVNAAGRGAWPTMTAKLTRGGRYYFRAYFPADLVYISRYARYSSTVSVYVR